MCDDILYTRLKIFTCVRNFLREVPNHEYVLHCQASFSRIEILSQLLTILFTIVSPDLYTYCGKVQGFGQRFFESSSNSLQELDNSLVMVLIGVSRVALLLRC